MSDGPLEDRDPITDDAFWVLLDWYMVSDPWVEAYHDFQTDAHWRGGKV